MNNTGTYNTWIVERNWNGTYRISPEGLPSWGLNIEDGEVIIRDYQCDFNYSDEWTLCPVEAGTASLFCFTEDASEINTTYGMDTINQMLSENNYTSQVYVDANASSGFTALKNSDLFFYNGHGLPGKLNFYNSQQIRSDLVVAGQDQNSLHLLSNDALARQRFILMSSCLTGADFNDDNMVGRMYWLGAHSVIGHFHEIENEIARSWDSALMTNILLGRSVGSAIDKANWYLYQDYSYLRLSQWHFYPYGFMPEIHSLGDINYQPCYTFVTNRDIWFYYQYKNTLQLTYKTHYTGTETAEEKQVKDSDGTVVSKRFTLPRDGYGCSYDVYTDLHNGVYWYNTGTNILYSYEPYTENLELGETIVDGEAAKTAADVFLESTDYDVTGYTVITSNEYSKNYTIRYQSPVKEDCYLTFNLQADTDGTVYIVKFTVQN